MAKSRPRKVAPKKARKAAPRGRAPAATARIRAPVTASRIRSLERKLAESEAKFRDFTEASSDWLWETDALNRYSWFSGNLERGVGRPSTHYLGRDRFEIAVEAGADLSAEPWKSHVEAIRRREPFRDFLHYRRTPKGEFWLRLSGVPRFDARGHFVGYRAVVQDVSAQMQSEQRARNAGEFLRDALDSLNELVAITDAEDRIVVANRAFRRLNENSAFVEIGQSYEAHLRGALAAGHFPDAAGREEAWLRERMAARRRGGTSEIRRKGDRWLQVTDRLLPGGGILTFSTDITARRAAERVLVESESRFRDFAYASGEWFWETDADLRYTWISEGVERVGGQHREQLYGKSRLELWRERGIDLDDEPWRSHVQVLERREPFRSFRYFRVVNGDERWISTSGLPVFNPDGSFRGYRGIGVDITREVELERRAHEADSRLRAAIEDLDASITVTDAEDRIVIANRAFRELNDYSDFLDRRPRYEEHLRLALSLGRIPEAIGREEQWLHQRLAQRREGGSFEVQRQDGRWLEVAEQRLPDGGTITYTVNITARKNAERAMRDVNAALEQRVAERTRELQAAYHELESFSYSVSHDLRAPLRAISGFASILRDEESEQLSAEGRRHLDTIDRSAQQMGRLVDALLELVRLSRKAILADQLDMTAIAREAWNLLSPDYPRARLALAVLPPARGDATLVRQVFVNLLGNALKYSSTAAEPCVEVGAESALEGMRYFVRDNGVGFDMRYVGKLFKPFERLHADPAFQGTGIGLALASLIVHRHGGRIDASSVPGEGATFRFTLGAG